MRSKNGALGGGGTAKTGESGVFARIGENVGWLGSSCFAAAVKLIFASPSI